MQLIVAETIEQDHHIGGCPGDVPGEVWVQQFGLGRTGQAMLEFRHQVEQAAPGVIGNGGFSNQISVSSHQFPVTSFQFPVISFTGPCYVWSLVAGRWLLVKHLRRVPPSEKRIRFNGTFGLA